jgi:hypothetical protein
LKLHVAPAGSPAQLNVTACLNPFSGVTVTVSVPAEPAAKLSDELLIASE